MQVIGDIGKTMQPNLLPTMLDEYPDLCTSIRNRTNKC